MSNDVDAILDEVEDVETETLEAVAEPIETPETEAPAAEVVAEPVAEAPALPDGYKLDSLGRVHGPDGRVVSKEEAERIKASVAPPEPVTPATPAVPSTPVEPTPVAPVEPEPFMVRHSGQKVPIPHTFRNADGTLTVKPEGEAIVRDLFTQALAHRQSWPQEKARYEQAIQEAQQMAKVAPQKYNNAAVLLWDHLSNPEWLAAAVQQPERIELLREKLDLVLRRADLEIPKTPETPKPDDAQIERAAQAILTEEVDDLLDSPSAKALFSADERKELSETMLALMPAFFTEHQGEIVLDRHALKRAFDREVSKQQRITNAASKAAQDAQKAKAAAAFNAAQKVIVPAPTTPRPTTPTPALTAAGAGKRKSFDQTVNDIWNESDDE